MRGDYCWADFRLSGRSVYCPRGYGRDKLQRFLQKFGESHVFYFGSYLFPAYRIYKREEGIPLAMRISPTEAARYREKRAGRKKLWAGVSFALSGIIFLVAFTLPMGYNVENMVKRYHTADVRIRRML